MKCTLKLQMQKPLILILCCFRRFQRLYFNGLYNVLYFFFFFQLLPGFSLADYAQGLRSRLVPWRQSSEISFLSCVQLPLYFFLAFFFIVSLPRVFSLSFQLFSQYVVVGCLFCLAPGHRFFIPFSEIFSSHYKSTKSRMK